MHLKFAQKSVDACCILHFPYFPKYLIIFQIFQNISNIFQTSFNMFPLIQHFSETTCEHHPTKNIDCPKMCWKVGKLSMWCTVHLFDPALIKVPIGPALAWTPSPCTSVHSIPRLLASCEQDWGEKQSSFHALQALWFLTSSYLYKMEFSYSQPPFCDLFLFQHIHHMNLGPHFIDGQKWTYVARWDR